jgi:hypothetical protein
MNIKKVQRETVLARPAGSRQDRRWIKVAAASRRCSLSDQRRDASATLSDLDPALIKPESNLNQTSIRANQT